MTKLQRLFTEQGQSPWLDNLTRDYLRDGTLAQLVADGVRGVTANPTIFARAIQGTEAYDEQFLDLIEGGRTVADAYWDLVTTDVRDACAPGVDRPQVEVGGGGNGVDSPRGAAIGRVHDPSPRPACPHRAGVHDGESAQ